MGLAPYFRSGESAMLVTSNRRLALRTREGFTLLEVLVVVAILLILAGAASVAVFRYLDDAKADSARNQMTMFENACKNYMAKNDGNPPPSLMELVAPTDGNKPLLDGGPAMLISPFNPNQQYQYDPTHVDSYGAPDPIVSLQMPDGRTLLSSRRKSVQ